KIFSNLINLNNEFGKFGDPYDHAQQIFGFGEINFVKNYFVCNIFYLLLVLGFNMETIQLDITKTKIHVTIFLILVYVIQICEFGIYEKLIGGDWVYNKFTILNHYQNINRWFKIVAQIILNSMSLELVLESQITNLWPIKIGIGPIVWVFINDIHRFTTFVITKNSKLGTHVEDMIWHKQKLHES
ncbi:hypothetical protein ACJX0J_040186, partial [Zea mays]